MQRLLRPEHESGLKEGWMLSLFFKSYVIEPSGTEFDLAGHFA